MQLNWTASTTPGATYDVYRRNVLSTSSYVWLNELDGGISAPSFLDETVTHTTLYYYYVIAGESGFQSAQSNFNTDCGETPGPDCVQARPPNLVAPDT